MVLTSFQIVLLFFEILALAFGTVLVGRVLNLPGFKPMGTAPGRLAYWAVEGFEVALLIVLVLLLGILFQGATVYFAGAAINGSIDRKGLEVAVYQAAFHGGGLLAWPVFHLLRRRLFAAYSTVPPSPAHPMSARAGWSKAVLGGCVTLLCVMPLIALVSLGWTSLLTFLGVPSEAQDMIAKFQNTRSPLVLAGMLFVACVLAPINEELLFRRGLYHFFRQRFGRIFALAVSACLFGLLHQNTAGFLPLASLGVILALAYERTGDIRVPIIAHGLFNLNTIVALLAGLSG